jgi:hypothetical protein
MDAGDELGPATKPTDRHGFLPSSPVLHGPAQDGAMHVGVSVRREAKATSRRARACVRACNRELPAGRHHATASHGAG